MSTLTTIVTVCGDPGGAEAIAPVIKIIMEDKRISVINYTYHQGLNILRKHGINYQHLPIQVDNNEVAYRLQKYKTSFLLTGTSHNHLNWEKFFIREARKLGIYSLSVLDFWSNYALRFSNQERDLTYLPNKIAIMDEYALKEMCTLGFPANCLMVTGQPAFDYLKKHRHYFSDKKKNLVRSSLNVKDNNLLVLFASQPLKKMRAMLGDASHLDYDEKSVLNNVIHSLEMISKKNNKLITLLVRPHPREEIIDFTEYKSKKITIIISTKNESHDCIMASDLVIGMTSILLVEACYLGNIVVSLQPGSHKQDALPTNKNNLTIAVYKNNKITPTLEKFLLDESSRHALKEKINELTLETKASQHIVNHIYSQLGKLN